MPRPVSLRINVSEPHHVRENIPAVAAVLTATALALTFFLAPGAHAGGQTRPPVQTEESTTSQTISDAEIRLTEIDTIDNGPHSIEKLTTLQPGVVRNWKDIDPKGVMREEGAIQYGTTPGGASVKTEETRDYFSDHGTLDARTISDWDFSGKLTSYRLTDYSFRGYKISDHITKYETEGHVESTWNPRTYDWNSTTVPYTGAAGPAATPAQPGNSLGTQMNWNLRVDYKIGCLLPLDYHAGDQFSGSCWKADYAEGFKTVPGLYEYTLPIKSYPLQDGTPNWSDLEIGVKGYGYSPLGSDGRFSLHIPMDWKGSLQFQVRQPDYLTGNLPYTTNFQIGNSVASPALPQNLLPAQFRNEFDYDDADYLVDLWNEAFDLKEEYSDLKAHGENYPGEIEDVLDDLDDVYDEIDYATDYLPTSVIVSMARGMAADNRDLNATLRAGTLTPDQETKLQEYDRWAAFLEREADHFTDQATLFSHYALTPYWESPVQSVGKLGALRGPFYGDPFNTGFHIDGTPISPIAMTPQLFYYMPPPGLTAGEHTYTIDSPGMPETTMPFLYMWLTMWADQLNLHKGQHTTYHCKLNLNFTGSNSLLNSSSSSSFFPSDLVNSSELQGSSMPGPSRKGNFTLSIVDGSPGVITMKNVFETFDVSRFQPQGSVQVDGGVGAIRDGSFSILGEAHAYLQPVLGLGLWPPSSTPAASSTPAYGNPFSSYDWNFGPSAPAASIPNCPTGSAGTTTPGTSGASATSATSNFSVPISHCMGSAAFDLYTGAIGGQPAVKIGNPPTQSEAEAARNRVSVAEQKSKEALANWAGKRLKELDAWRKAITGVSEPLMSNLQNAASAFGTADFAFEKALDEFGKALNSASAVPAANAKLEAASVALADAKDTLDRAKQDVIDHMTPENRAAWQSAKAAADDAKIDITLTEEELRDAREALDKLPPSAWLKLSF